jgi:hypothetical protein
VYFELSYTGTSKKEVTDKYHKDEPVITSNEHMSKILVASNVSFPFCEFGLDDSTVELKVKSDVSSSETVAYTRDLLIDCIILEPVQ